MRTIQPQVTTPRQATFIERAPLRWRACLLRSGLCLSLLAGAWCQAQSSSGAITLSYMEGQVPVAPDAVTTLGTDLFGDKVNLFNGLLTFEQTDTHLPGNSALPVALVRSYLPGRSDGIRGQLGDWDMEAPRMSGVFSFSHGWTVGPGASVARCSSFSLPPMASSPSAGSSFDSVGDPAVKQAASPAPVDGTMPGIRLAINFTANDYHQGVHISVAGMGRQEVLTGSGSFIFPTDGATYVLATREQWRVSCLPSIQNGAGEGFFAVSPQGVRYRFDWMSSRFHPDLTKDTAFLSRREFFLHATEVTDRFGNWVRYTYDAANPGLLTQIQASDGRAITITNLNGVVSSVSDGTRTLTYRYTYSMLSSIELPDNSKWTFNLGGLTSSNMSDMGQGATCENPGTGPPDDLIGSMTHPSGATGIFRMNFAYHGRTYVDKVCRRASFWPNPPIAAIYPKLVISQTLTEKSITGPGLPPLKWTYRHGGPQGWNPCTGCGDRKTVVVTEPDGQYKAYEFGVRWRVDEGLLLRVSEGWTGSGWQRTTETRYRTAQDQAYPDRWGQSLLRNSDVISTLVRPVDQRVITQQGTTFTWQVDPGSAGFDALARPLKVSQFSSLNPSVVRIEASEYYDNLPLWVMGQHQRLVELTSNREVERHTFNDASAQKSASYAFGLLSNSFAYRPDGTLQTLYNAANRSIVFQNFMRGKPQQAVFADGTVATRVVNNLGNVASSTNEVGTTTNYTFDAMGRVASISYPDGDALSYAPTLQSFAQVPTDEHGLAPGHWRQTITTGSGIRLRYFDALWRLRLDHLYDASNPLATQSFVETRYDADNGKSFQSYPTRSFFLVDQPIAGLSTTYDGLGRVVQQRADSELGPLITATHYEPGFKRLVINPRGHRHTFAFQAFDTPNEEHIAAIWAPENASTGITRDVFGKALSITRSGNWQGSDQYQTRSYVYDVHQRLCKTVEPETDATIVAYDASNLVAWRSSGQTQTGTSACDQGSVAPSATVYFSYDARDRLTWTTYGDGSQAVTRSYTPDGLLNRIGTTGGGVNPITWVYGYNNLRLLTSESYNFGSPLNWVFTWTIDANGHVSALGDRMGVIHFAPNALGQATQVGSYATSVTYHPNGAVASYTLGNAVRHTQTQNVRGLPETMKDAGVVHNNYAYDANGNVSAIHDWMPGGADSRIMPLYDGLDRLRVAHGPWGSATFSYDALDNLVDSTMGARSLTHRVDSATNRLVELSGSQTLNIGYDANGNITQRGTQGFVFDIGNRMRSATDKARYVYDGHGRRNVAFFTGGDLLQQAYTQDGKLRYTRRLSQGDRRHVYLGDKLIAEMSVAGVTTYAHTDALGSPVAWTASTLGPNGAAQALSTTRYEPYGATVAGSAVPATIGFTGHVNDADTGLVYMQQRYYDPIAGRFLIPLSVQVEPICGML